MTALSATHHGWQAVSLSQLELFPASVNGAWTAKSHFWTSPRSVSWHWGLRRIEWLQRPDRSHLGFGGVREDRVGVCSKSLLALAHARNRIEDKTRPRLKREYNIPV
jgi:hypothetical protein